MMKIEVLDKGKKPLQWMRFSVDGVDTSFVNSLRRSIRSEVQVMAIDYADIKYNNSVLYDEMLSLRLGLIPILADVSEFVSMDECGCSAKPVAERGCEKCSAKLSLSAEGPGMVYSKDLKPASSPKIKAALDSIPIVWLEEGHKVELEAIAVLGKGKTHVKWQGGIAAYQNYPLITLNADKCGDGKCEKCVDACPRGVFSRSGGKVQTKDALLCNLCNACINACPVKNGSALKVEADQEKFIFYVESFGQMTPEELVVAATKALEKKADEFKSSIDELELK